CSQAAAVEATGGIGISERGRSFDQKCRMTNVKCRRNTKTRIPKPEMRLTSSLGHWEFGILSSFGLRDSSFSIEQRRGWLVVLRPHVAKERPLLQGIVERLMSMGKVIEPPLGHVFLHGVPILRS